MIDDGQMAAMCDSSAPDAINNYLIREIHFYKAGTLNSQNPVEVQWKGIAQFGDCDDQEGVSINNLNAVYLSNNTWLTKRDDNTFRGTAENANDGTNDLETTVWAEISGSPDNPLVIKYYGSIIHGATINFLGTTYTGKLTYNSNNYNKETTEQIISLGYDITVSENMFDTIEGFEFVGWNTKADGTGTSYTPNQVTQFKSDTTLYAMWKISDEFPNTPKVTIDMTFAQAGGGVECNHVWEVKHGTLDQSGNPVAQTGKTTHHWEQCWKCGTIINLEQHTMKNTTDAENTCSLGTPPLVAKCTGLDGRCNYTEEIPKLKHESYTLEKPDNAWVWGYHVQHRCKRCNVEMEPTTQWCRDANGNKLGCGTAGTCAICGFTYDGRHLALTTEDDYWNVPGIDGNFAGDTQPTKTLKLICFTCKKEFGHVDFTMHRDGNTEGRNYTVDYNIQLEPGVNIAVNFKEGQFDSTNGDHGHWNYSSGNLITSGVRDYDITINGTKVNPLSDIRNISGYNNKMQIRVNSYPNSTAQYLYQFLWLCNNGGWSIGGQPQAASACFRHLVPNELGRPIYLDHKTTDERVPNVPANQLNGTAGWSTKQQVTVSFADLITSDNNALNNVWLSLKDKDGKTLYDWTPGNRSSYSSQYPQNKYTFTFDIVAEIKGTQTLTAEAHDATWNTQQTQIQVQNIDTLAPQPANEFVTGQEWQRTKDFSYLFTDKGIGHIQVSFNNNSYDYGTEQDIYRFANTTDWENYSRDYLLTGDVTGAAGVTIYAKDLLGNAASYRATVYNLDNTKPTVTEVTVDGGIHDETKTAEITGYNDFCEKIQKEGSGVVKFAVKKALEDGSAPEVTDKDFQDSNTFTGLEAGTYYAYVKDRVDWVSEPYVFYVDTYPSTPEVTIDMTFVQAGGGINCDHIFEAKYDAQYHWEQCWKCGTIRNKSTHHLVVDSGLYNSCWSGAPKVMAHCDGMDGKCNHYEYLPKPAHEAKDLTWIQEKSVLVHYHLCKNCSDWIDIEQCLNASGNPIGCGTVGTCSTCGQYSDGRHSQLKAMFVYEGLPSNQPWEVGQSYREFTQHLQCQTCEKQFGTVKLKQTKDTSDPEGRTVNVIWDIQMNPGVSIDFGRGVNNDRIVSGGYTSAVNPNTWNSSRDATNKVIAQELKEYNTSGQVIGNFDNAVNWRQGRVLVGYTFKSLPDAYQNLEWLVVGFIGNDVPWLSAWKLNDVMQCGCIRLDYNAFPDTQAPYYLEGSASVVNSETDNQIVNGTLWSKKATVQTEFYDTLIQTNYLETEGYIRFYDKDMNPLTEWETTIKNGFYNNYQKFYKAKDIVAEAKGTQPIYVEFKDKTGNISEPLELQIQNLDALAPQPVNEFETSQEWSRTKDFSYMLSDHGIGHVEISFNNPSYEYGQEQDIYKPGNTVDTIEYSRDYTLTGDVTGAAGVTIYAKDRLGNEAAYPALVYNLDNTKPTIRECIASYENQGADIKTTITVTDSDDFCEKIQNEGSGIAGYTIVKVPGDASNQPAAPATPDESQFERRNTWDIDESAWYFIYAIDNVQWISDPYPIYVEKVTAEDEKILATAVDATAANGHGGINLDWQFKDWNTTTNKAWQAQAGENEYEGIINNPDKWVPVQLIDLTMRVEPIYVLNLAPAEGTGDIGQPLPSDPQQGWNREWTFPRYDWDGNPTGETYTVNMSQFAALKAWMEGGSVKNLKQMDGTFINETYEQYGKSPYTGQQIIRVIPLYTREVNKDIQKYLWFDEAQKTWKTKVNMDGFFDPNGKEVEISEIFIGTADVNGWTDDQPSQDLLNVLDKFLQTGGQIVAGHDSIGGHEPKETWTLKQIRDKFKVWTFTDDTDKIPKYGLWGQTVVKVTKQGLLTNFPYELPLGTELKIPLAHTAGNSSYGTVWMEFQSDGKDYERLESEFPFRNEIQGNALYYLTTNANTAMIQTGHSQCVSTQDERRIIANTLFYLKQTSSYNKATDNSAQDFSAPDKVQKIDIQNTELDTVGVTVERPKDNGTAYTHVAQQFLKTNVAEKFGMDNGNIGTTNFVQQEVITGTKGYYYYVDANNNQTISLQNGIVTTSTGIKFDNANKGVANVENPNTIYNKELIIEYLRETVESPQGGLESITVNQDSATDKSISFNINSKALREQFTENVVYLHIAPYDNAGNIGETIQVPISLDKIVYMPNGGIDSNGTTNPAVQNIIVGQETTIYGTIFTKEGFRFKGWNTSEDGSGTQYNAGGAYVFDKQMILYAQWDEVQSLTVDPNKGWWIDSGKVTVKPGQDDTGIDKDPTGQRYDDKVSFNLGEGDIKEIPDALRFGYNFYGWKIQQENQ